MPLPHLLPKPTGRAEAFAWDSDMQDLVGEAQDACAALLRAHSEPAALAAALQAVFHHIEVEGPATPVDDGQRMIARCGVGSVTVEHQGSGEHIEVRCTDGVWHDVDAPAPAPTVEALAAELLGLTWWGDIDQIMNLAHSYATP